MLLTVGIDHVERAGTSQDDKTHWAVNDEFHRVPNAHDGDDIEPAGRPVIDEHGTQARGVEIRHSEQHRGHAPLEAAASADGVEQDVRGHIPAHEAPDVDADDPGESKHGGSPLLVRQRGTLMDCPRAVVPSRGRWRNMNVVALPTRVRLARDMRKGTGQHRAPSR